MLPPELLNALKEKFGKQVSTNEADRNLHASDQSSHDRHLPDVVVWPVGTEQVSALAQLANLHKTPLVGWGAGTSLEGNPIPINGGIVVDFGRMDQILKIHEKDFQVTVQPGMLYKDMNKALARYGLFFPPDPGANASIGGMIANNAAGTRTVKYGATKDNVLALEVVLANGNVIRTGSRAVKQSAGYDLTHLFTGSEGTLGLITEATLKLFPIPEHICAIIAAFPSVTNAAQAVYEIIGAGLNPAALELIDEPTIQALKDEASFEITTAPNLFIEFNGASQAALQEKILLAGEICQAISCMKFQSGLGREAHRQMWDLRHRAFEIISRRYPGMDYALSDVAVPISYYPELVSFTSEAMARLELPGALFGHAGDGNLHTAVFYYPDDKPGHSRASKLNDTLVTKALDLGGTSTGEHGVGIGKQKYMVQEHGQAAVDLMRQLKSILDPNNILNPGKVLG